MHIYCFVNLFWIPDQNTTCCFRRFYRAICFGRKSSWEQACLVRRRRLNGLDRCFILIELSEDVGVQFMFISSVTTNWASNWLVYVKHEHIIKAWQFTNKNALTYWNSQDIINKQLHKLNIRFHTKRTDGRVIGSLKEIRLKGTKVIQNRMEEVINISGGICHRLFEERLRLRLRFCEIRRSPNQRI